MRCSFSASAVPVVLLPKAKSWDTLIESLAKFPDDFLSEREQPTEVDRREGLD